MNTQQRDFALQLKQHILMHSDKVYMNFFVKDINECTPGLEELSCGTVGCIAGTACFLADGEWEAYDSERRAIDLLGINYKEADALFFFPFANGNYIAQAYSEERQAIQGLAPGSRDYAKVVAQALQKCIDRNYQG